MTSGNYRPRHRQFQPGKTPAAAASVPHAEPAASESAPAAPSAARSSLVMFLGTFTSRILGMVRSPILLGAAVGLTTPAANAFDVANKMPNLFWLLIMGGLSAAVFVPAIVKASKNSADNGEAFINKLITLAGVVLLSTTALLTLAAPLVTKIFAATLDPQWYQLTVIFTYWCMPQVFFYGMYDVLGQVLNARQKFGPYTWAPALNNVIAIAGLVLMLVLFGSESVTDPTPAAEWLGARAAVLGGVSTLGIAAQALVLIIPMRIAGIRYRPDFKWRGSGLGRTGRVSLWVIATTTLNLLPSIVLSNVAAGATQRALDAGENLAEVAGNSVYSAAHAIYMLPTSLITVSIATAVYTRMTIAINDDHMAAAKQETSRAINTISAINYLAVAGILVLAIPVSRIIVPSVTPTEVFTLGRVLAIMSLGIIPLGAITVFNKIYYALEDTRTLFFIWIPVTVILVGGYWVTGLLPPRQVLPMVAVVMVIANLVLLGLSYFILRRKIGSLGGVQLLISHLRLGAVALVTGAAGAGLMYLIGWERPAHSIAMALYCLFGVGTAMVVIYLLLLRLLRIPEAELLFHYLQRLGRKLRRK
ncbi:MAG: lipid II flippase MurJ [Trueperella sp.]|nr:lipid II flippase MurJ [Trueperella sp.]